MKNWYTLVFVCLTFVSRIAFAQDEPLSPPPMGEDETLQPPAETPPPAPPPQVEVAPPPKVSVPQANDSPVIRATGGDLGMYFRFGGLANLTHTNNSNTVGPLVFTDVGMKFVFSEKWMLPVYFGTGLQVDSPSNGDAQTNWGIEMGAGIEYHFRIWRRISPFLGGQFGFGITDPNGSDNLTFGVGLGPNLGVEYYIGDRLSLTALYSFVIQLEHQQAGSLTSFGFATLAGGALNITYYF